MTTNEMAVDAASRDVGGDQNSRLANLAAIRDMGINPYPVDAYHPTCTVGEALLARDSNIKMQTRLKIAGRLIGCRRMGAVSFLDVLDDGARIQFYITEDDSGADSLALVDLLNLGDFVGGEGTMFLTRRQETTLRVNNLVLLGKSVKDIAIGKRTASGAVHHALADQGRLVRERHVALLADNGLRNRIVLRDKIMREIRAYFHENGFLEVETPIIGRHYGGAAARPFTTHVEALDADFYLRVSPECALKRVLCGGLNKVFEIGKNFRNEGIDHSHNPEFTAIEWYEAWSDYRHQMERFETLVSLLARAVAGDTIVHFRGRALDFTSPWPRLSVLDAVAEAFKTSPDEVTLALLRSEWIRLGLAGACPLTWGEALAAIFEEVVEPTLWGPLFIIDHPLEISPLTKEHRLDKRLVERFEPFAGGMEIGNAYSELNDPIEQRRRLEDQRVSREERYGLDEPFLGAIDDGMPQAGGAGMGIDRIVMLLTGGDRLSDVILFPTV